MSITITLTDQNKATLRTAAFGAVSLMSAASGSPHKAGTAGSNTLYASTGQVGHVLAAAKAKDIKLKGKNVAELADQVLPALTAAVALLEQQDKAEADNFRGIVRIAIEAAEQSAPSPTVADMTRKITAALG